MYFDDEYRKYLKNMILDSIDDRFNAALNRINWNESIKEYGNRIIDDLELVLDDKLYHKLSSKIEELESKDWSKFTLTDKEKMFAKLNWVDKDTYYFNTSEDISKLILNRIIRNCIRENLNDEEFEILLENCRSNKSTSANNILKLFKDDKSVDDLISRFTGIVKKSIDYAFNDRINCGGYAFGIDKCIFPYNQNLSESVSSLLNRFDFIRLLGDTKLNDDEYIVMYKVSKNGHHFVRINDDGSIVEKDGNKSPKKFENWGDMKELPQVVFAVKKEHDIVQDGSAFCFERGIGFEETVDKAIKNKKDKFMYHCKMYFIQEENDKESLVLSEDGKRVAYVLVDENQTLTEIYEGKEDFVQNLGNDLKFKIKDGKLLNLDEFKKGELDIQIE